MKNKFFKKALSVFTAMAMMLSLMTGIPFSELGLGITAVAYADGVASITNGETVTNYATFDEALANWTDGTTLTLLADVTLTEHIKTYAKGLILDLNGHKIECSDTLCTIWIDGDSGSELTIRDSQDGGHINGKVYAVVGESKLCLESGKVEAVTANGDFTMTGGRIISEDGIGLFVNAKVDVVISGGEIYGSNYGVWINQGNVIISGDTKITGAGQYAIQSNSSAEVVISGTPTISGGAGEFILDSKITLNTQPADGETWRVKIDTKKITDGIFAVPGEGIALDASKFASAMDGYDVKQNAKGELLLCNHQTAYAAVSNEDGSTHKMLCCCRETTVEASVACSGFGATCQTKAVCAACGQSYGETNPDVHTFNDDGTCACGAVRGEAINIDLSTLTGTYVISNSGEYIFTGSGSYGIKVESGNPKIVLNNVNISLTDGDYYENNPINGIHIATTGGTTEILVLGESSITAKDGAGIFVAEGGTVKITGSSREDILIATAASGCSGIGGYVYYTNGSVNCGNIEISSVTVKAFGSQSGEYDVAPAIGGAGNANCGYITIDNADVYAEGFISSVQGSSAIGTGFDLRNYEGGTIGEISIINDSKVYVTRGNYCDYIGCCGSEVEPAEGVVDATAKSSTIYCYDSTGTTEPVQTLKYGALGTLLVEDENGNWVCDGEHSDDITTYQNEGSTITAICENCKCEFIVLALITENKIFDGTPVTAVVEKAGSLKEVTVDYYQGDTLIGDEAPINAGTYTAKITYEGVTASVEFTISPKSITVTADNKSKTYDEGDTELTYTITDGTLVNGETLTGTLVRAEGEDVGTYAITQGTLTNENNPNYDITFVEGTFTINGVDISGATAVQNGTLTYDGTAQTPTFTVTLGNATLTADDYDVTVTAQTNAGSYTATIAGKGNCSGTIADVAWEILHVNIADTSITYAPLTYNGAEQTPVFTIKLGDYTLNASDYSVTVTAQINAGDYIATIVGNANFDGNINVDWSIGKKAADEVTSPTAATITYGQTLSEATLTNGWSWVDGTVIPTVINNGYAAEITVDDSNYDYTSIDGYNADTHKITRTIAVTVEKAAPTITTEPYAAAGLVYDGSAKVLVNEGAVTGGSFVYSLTGNNYTATLPTATEAKEYTVYWRVAGDDNHKNSETFNFKVTIAKATPPALTIPTATTITYGEKLSASTLSDSSWAWVDGTIVPNANAYYNAYIEVDDSNYDYTGVDGYDDVNHRVVKGVDVIITRATLTITANSYTIKVGDTLPTYAYDVTGLVNGDTLPFNVSLSCSATDSNTVGTYPITISGVASDALASLYAPIYVNGTLTISEKDIQEIAADDVTLTYGETGKKITATTSGDGAISYSTTSDVISVAADGTITALKAGTATVTVKAAETDNYAEATTTISVTVNKKKVAIPTADTTEYTYTGTAQTYGVTSTDDYTVEGGVQTNAGEYPITITLNNENYEWDGTLGTYKFVINKAAVTVTAKSYTIKVGDTLPTYAYDVAGLVNSETLPIDVTISCNAADSNTAGTYTITVSGAANSTNYTFAYVNGTLTISNKLEQTITASNVTLTYGETGKKITATSNGNGAISYSTTSDVISVAADGTITALKAGTATVTINVAETDTYAAATKTVTVTVNKAAVTITARSYTIKVGDTLPTYAYDVTGLVNGETLPIDVTISCNAADSNTAGTYDIIVSGAAASDNYTFSYVKGTLTVSEKEVVAAPTFTPATGTTFTSSQKVTISCATAGAKIYYTTDGTEPTTASTLYNGAFTITTTTTIKAIAVKDGMTDSAVVTATYTKKSSGGGGGGGGYTPSHPTTPNNPEIGGKSASWATIASDISKLPIGSEITIELNGNYDVPLIVIKAIADREVKVTFVVDSTRSWYVDGAEIETPTAADLSIIYIGSLKADGVRGDVGTKFRIDGTNIPTELIVALDKIHAGKFANLYKKKENELVFVDNIKVDENGKVILPVSEQGDYVIMLCEYSDRKGDVSNDGVTNALDASAILKDIVELAEATNPVMLDYNGDGKVNALDASAILKDIVNGKI